MCHGQVQHVFSLDDMPIANDFQEKPNSGESYPLHLMECDDCHHVQARHVIDGLFDAYKYRTPDAFDFHLSEVADLLKLRFPLTETVVEIGSNNGLNLDILSQRFHTVVGVDPAAPSNYRVYSRPFTERLAKDIYKRKGEVDLIIANNVFAHIDDLDDVFRGIDWLLAPQGAVIIEVQDFQASVRGGIFDMLYHEHLDQHTVPPWRLLLERHHLHLSSVESIMVHGGSLRLTATRHHQTDYPEIPINWKRYSAKVGLVQCHVREELKGNVAAWGAAAKLTVMIHQCGLQDVIQYCVDNTLEKQGLYIPGTDIEIVPEFHVKPDRVLLGAWNYEHVFNELYPDLIGVNPYG